MQAAVADTGPLNYLIFIEAVEVLPRLFSPISIPAGVKDELSHRRLRLSCAHGFANSSLPCERFGDFHDKRNFPSAPIVLVPIVLSADWRLYDNSTKPFL